jgi:hypothetical protein
MRKTLHMPHLSTGAWTMAAPSCRVMSSITSRCHPSARHPIVHRSRTGAAVIHGCMPTRGGHVPSFLVLGLHLLIASCNRWNLKH